jgi:LmeA-like phospholipid-binding
MRWTAGGVVIAVVLVLGGDRLLRSLAETKIARQATCQLRATSSSVRLGGAFIGLQILRNHFAHITVHSEGVRESGGPVDLTADLFDVRQVGHHQLHSGHGMITVVVPFTTVAAGAGKGFTASVSDGELVFTPPPNHSDTSGSTVFARVSLDGNDVVVTPVRVALAGRTVPLAKAARIAARSGESLAPVRTPLPASLTRLGLTSATATDQGLVLSAAGPDLTLVLPDVPGCT